VIVFQGKEKLKGLTAQRTSMSSTLLPSSASLTVTLQSTQTAVTTESYLYEDALNDAEGYGYLSDYSGSPRLGNNTLFLWESGCRVGDVWNCTLACSDLEAGPNMVWNSSEAMFTLHNCLVYPILATAAANNWLVQDPAGLLDKFEIPSRDILPTNATAEDAKLGASAWPVINGCLTKVCAPLNGENADRICSGPDMQRTKYRAGPQNNPWKVNLVRFLNMAVASRLIADNVGVRLSMKTRTCATWVSAHRTQISVAPE
jgi:hypothetical protein